jgi:MFS family permease
LLVTQSYKRYRKLMTAISRRTILVLIASILVLLIAIGIRSSFGLFMRPVTFEFGWGRSSFAFAIALQNLVWGATQPLAGAIADRYGTGKVVAISGILYAVGLWLMSGVATPTDLSISAGILIGIALSGTGFPIILAVVGRNVDEKRRSLFLGLASAGGSSGQVIVLPFGQYLIEGYGWSQSLLVFALMTMLIVPIAAALAGRTDTTGDSQEHLSLNDALRDAGSHSGYWFLVSGFFVCGFHVTFLATHLPAYIVDQGADAKLGAMALALIGLGNIASTIGGGYLGGRYRKKYILGALYLGRAIVMSLFLLAPVNQVTVALFALSLGTLWLGTVPLTSGLVAEIFGMRYLATLFGIVFFSHQVGAFCGAWFGGYIYDLSGSYDIVWYISIALGLASAALHMPIQDQPFYHTETAYIK